MAKSFSGIGHGHGTLDWGTPPPEELNRYERAGQVSHKLSVIHLSRLVVPVFTFAYPSYLWHFCILFASPNIVGVPMPRRNRISLYVCMFSLLCWLSTPILIDRYKSSFYTRPIVLSFAPSPHLGCPCGKQSECFGESYGAFHLLKSDFDMPSLTSIISTTIQWLSACRRDLDRIDWTNKRHRRVVHKN